MKPNALVFFVKAPILGKVKTRLAKQIGEHRALEFYEECVRNLINGYFDTEVQNTTRFLRIT